MDEISGIRPRLRQDSIFFPIENGVFLRNEKGALTLKGSSIYQTISVLAPCLNGERTIEDICAGLDSRRKGTVYRLIQALLDRGMVQDHIPETDVDLPEAVQWRFRSQIDFIEHCADKPRKRFKAFRESRILVAGSGMPFRALATALLRNGLKHLVLACSASEREHLGEAHAEATRLRDQGVEACISVTDSASQELAAPADDVFSVLAFASDYGSLEEICRWCRRCHDNGIAFLPGLVMANQSWIGPYMKPGHAGCWMCAILRMSANLEPANQAALWRGVALGGDWSTRPARSYLPLSRIMGNSIAFELFKALAGHLAPESERTILIQELDTLESSRAAFLPHPLCPVCSSANPEKARHDLEDMVRGSRDMRPGSEPRNENPPGLLDRRTGIFRGFDDNDTVQLPLYSTSLTTSAAADLAVSPLPVHAVSHESLRAAREKAQREGAKQYASYAPDRRRMVRASIQQLLQRGTSFRAAEELSSWTGGPFYEPYEVIDWMPAYSWLRRDILQVPAASVYPLSSLNYKGVFETGTSGVGVGATFDQVSRDAICSALGYEMICETVRGSAAALTLKLDQLAALDPQCAYLARVLSRYEATVSLYELAEQGPVRVVVAEAVRGNPDPEPINRIGSGLSRLEAARNALLELVGELQNAEAGESPTSPAKPLPGFRLPRVSQFDDRNSSPYTEASSDPQAVLESLMDSGREPLFCDMTPLDLQGLFLVGRFLLTTAEPARGLRSRSEGKKENGERES